MRLDDCEQLILLIYKSDIVYTLNVIESRIKNSKIKFNCDYLLVFESIINKKVVELVLPTLLLKWQLGQILINSQKNYYHQLELNQLNLETDQDILHSVDKVLQSISSGILYFIDSLEKCSIFFDNRYKHGSWQISHIEIPDSELHNSGKFTSLITIITENLLLETFVLKPFSVKFQQIIKSLVANIPRFNKLIPKVLFCHEDFSLIDFVKCENNTFHTENECALFYEKCGWALSICFFFRITDMHNENMIVSNSNPVLIDWEMVMHRYMPIDLHTVDMTGLINTSDKMTALQGGGVMYQFSNEFSLDTLAFSHKKVVHNTNNRIKLNNSIVSPSNYHGSIIKGFYQGMQALAQNTSEITLNLLAKLDVTPVTVRHLMRTTKFYIILLNRMVMPEPFTNKSFKDYLREVLITSPALSSINSSIIDCEIDDLLHGDVPYFFSYTNSRSLHHHSGMIVSDYFTMDFPNLVINHLKYATEENTILSQANTIKSCLV